MTKEFLLSIAWLGLMVLIVADLSSTGTSLKSTLHAIVLSLPAIAAVVYACGLVLFLIYRQAERDKAQRAVYILYTALTVIITVGVVNAVDLLRYVIDLTFDSALNQVDSPKDLELGSIFLNTVSAYANVVVYGTLAALVTLAASMLSIARRAAKAVGLVPAGENRDELQIKSLMYPILGMLCSVLWGLYLLFVQ